MSAKKCCGCGLLSCFPCFSNKKSTLSAQPDSSEIANPSPEATLSCAPPSAAAPSQVNASTVMQNASQPIAPSDAVPSSSRGIVTPSALIPTTSQTTASLPTRPASSSTPSSLIPTTSQTTASPPTQPASSSTPSSSALIPTASQTTASPPTQPASSSTPSSSRVRKESDYAKDIKEAAQELDKENVDGDFSDLINYILQLLDFIEGCSDNVFVKCSSYRSSNKRTNPEDPLQSASRNRGLTKESAYSRHRHKCLFTVCLFVFPREEEDQIQRHTVTFQQAY